MDPAGFVVNTLLKEGLPKDVTVLAGKSSLTYADGRRADISNGVRTASSDIVAWKLTAIALLASYTGAKPLKSLT
jgi:hypothetical protein